MKDNFSQQANQYAAFRPSYPAALIDFIISLVDQKDYALDCGTGNGQLAGLLSPFFNKVFATDISKKQLDQATQKENIFYSQQPAEQTNFADDQFDLVTVAQAIHWFQFDEFYREIKRIVKPGGILAVIGYGLLRITKEVDEIIDDFYTNIVGPYWDAERNYIDQAYQSIPFPFEEIAAPNFSIEYKWSLEQLLGYLGTWSAVQHYQKDKGCDPVALITEKLEYAFAAEPLRFVRFPVFMRVGRV